MRTTTWITTVLFALSLCLATSSGCESMKKNPRTTGTVGGAAAGAAAGAAIDKDHPAEGAVVGGVVGGAAGNYGGKVYKDKNGN